MNKKTVRWVGIFQFDISMSSLSLICFVLCAVCAAANIDDGFFGSSEIFDNGIGSSEILDHGIGSSEIFNKEIESRIVGGENAKKGQFPYQVSLRNALYRQHYCGGSILSSRYIITAAHCTSGPNSYPNMVYAAVGTIRLNGGFSIKIEEILRHEHYDGSELLNDVSLLRTYKEIIFTKFVQPIALPTADLPEDTKVLLSGWGQTKVF